MTFKSLNIYLIILTVTSLFILFLYTFFYTPLEISLLENNTLHLEKVVSVSGNLKNLELKENNLFLEACNYSKCLKAVYFNISKNNHELLNNAYLYNKQVKLTGKYTLYNKKEEIIIYKFEVK